MNRKHVTVGFALLAVVAAAGYALFEMGMRQGSRMAASMEAPAAPAAGNVPQSIAEGEEATRRHIAAGIKAGDTDPANGRKVLYYHDPMVPGNKFDKPAKSPFMNMMLVPVYADGGSDPSQVTVSPRIQQNLGIRTAAVTEGVLQPQLATVGSIAFNERDQAVVQARAGGFVERLHVRATLDRVAKGQVLAELYVPDWVAAQEEFLAVRRMQGDNLVPLLDGARTRMRQAGMNEEQIRRVDSSGRIDARFAITAPIGGLVTEVGARDGMAVMPGATLFRINGFDTVWANADVPESQAALLRPGTRVVAQTAAVPGANFEGRVQALLPSVDAATRTLKARVELANPKGELVPGLFVSMRFMDTRQDKAILVPTEAIIQTGRRAVVMVAEDNGRFHPAEVQAGIESGGQTEIKRGLQPGQRVVVSSQFLIDSEASLKGVEARLNNEPAARVPAALQRYEGEGLVEAVGKEELTLSHGPIPALKWGPMTMDFRLPPAKDLPRKPQPGDRVTFEFTMDKDGPQITRISPMPNAPASGAKK